MVLGQQKNSLHYTKSEEGYDDKKLRLIANHILAVAKSKNINIEWGGNWKMNDTPHFELK